MSGPKSAREEFGELMQHYATEMAQLRERLGLEPDPEPEHEPIEGSDE